jgi:hypothetical protein
MAWGAMLLLAAAPCSHAELVYWTNDWSGYWGSTTNWSPNRVPGPSDTVVIQHGGPARIDIKLNADVTISELTMSIYNHALVVNGYTLTLNGGSISMDDNQVIQLDSGSLAGSAGSYVQGGVIEWTGGSLHGPLRLFAGAWLKVFGDSSGYSDLYGSLTNRGVVTLYTGNLICHQGSLVNLAGGTVVMWGPRIAGAAGTEFVLNQGVFSKVYPGTTVIGLSFTNYGTLDVQQGTAEFTGGGSFNTGSAFTGLGTNRFSNDTFTLNTSVTIPNAVLAGAALVGTNQTFAGGWVWTSGNLGIDGGSLTVATNASLTLGGPVGSRYNLYGSLTNGGTLVMAEGLLYVKGGQLVNLAGCSFRLSGSPNITGWGSFINRGFVGTSPGASCQIDIPFFNYSNVNPTDGSELRFAGGGRFDNGWFLGTGSGTTRFTGSSTFTLAGVVWLSGAILDGATLDGTNAVIYGNLSWLSGALGGAGGDLTLDWDTRLTLDGGPGARYSLRGRLTNTWDILLMSGLLVLENAQLVNQDGLLLLCDGTVISPSGSCRIINQGTVEKTVGSGTAEVQVPFSNPGFVEAMSGLLKFSGACDFAGGTLQFVISNLTTFGQISLPGTASLTGTVSAWLAPGYSPAPGSSFPVLSYGSRSGIFTGLALPPGVTWQTNYGPTTFTLTAAGLMPALGIRPTTTNSVLVWWPYPSTGWQLQVRTNLKVGNWANATNVPVQVGNNLQIAIAPPATNRFYRLIK